MLRVTGCRRVPAPPARTIPFKLLNPLKGLSESLPRLWRRRHGSCENRSRAGEQVLVHGIRSQNGLIGQRAPRPYQEAPPDSRRPASLEVRQPVPHQEGLIWRDIERPDGPLQHAGLRLAAVTVEPITLQWRIGQVRTVLDRIQSGSRGRKVLTHVL